MDIHFSSIRRLFIYIKSYRLKIAMAALCSILHNIFDVFPEILIGVTIDVLVNKQNSFLHHFGICNVMDQLYILAGLMFIIWCGQSLCEYLSELLWRNIAQILQHELRMAAYDHLQHLEMSYFEDKHGGELLTILNEDIHQLELFFDKGIADFIYFLISIILVGLIFFYLSPVIAICALFPVPIIFYIAYRFQSRLGTLYTAVRKNAGILGARLGNNILGITTIKSYTAEDYELNKLKKDSNAYKEAHKHSIAMSSAFTPLIRVVIATSFIITIILGGKYTLQGVLAIGSYAILVSMTQRLLWPFMYLAKVIDIYKRSMASAQRIFTLLDTPITIRDGAISGPISIEGKIEFKNISFAYYNGIKIFDDLSFSIEPGQKIGIVGASGSGKTTLIKLLLRFYDPLKGAILLNGMSIKDFTLHALRQVFGLVSQDVFLFNGTIKENIAYNMPFISDKKIENAAHIVGMHEFIMDLSHGYNTLIGEGGQKLSGGQRQRISIARAIVNEPPILIFDEATSSIDNETELSIQLSLEKIAKHRTVFVIAHRLSTVRNADTIFVLDKGMIVEYGKHKDLLRLNGIYNQLWRIQTGEISY